MTKPEAPAFTSYYCLPYQARCIAVNGHNIDSARSVILSTIGRLANQIRTIKQFSGEDLRLVVLPEYFLTGFPIHETLDEWREKACIRQHGPEFEKLSRIASDNGIFLSGNAYEIDDNFPELYFQTCFVFAPNGDFCLRYRRLISLFGPSPVDVMDRYLDIYGEESLLPVAQTEIGRLGAIASEEILYPEIARSLAMKGAEILLHNSAEFGSPRSTGKELCRLARAVENMAYVVSANSASIEGTDFPSGTTDGMSKVIDFRGVVLNEAGQGETYASSAEIDLAALRRYRSRPGMQNLLSRPPFEVFAREYSQAKAYPLNSLLSDGKIIVPERAEIRKRQQGVISRLMSAGVL